MVYRAYDRELKETVAIKVLRPDVARQSGRIERRFRSEIRLARRVRHRNVCSVYGDGEDPRPPLHLHGAHRGREPGRTSCAPPRGLPEAEAWDVARQVADGLRAIHDAGVVHRDLKTANLMRDRQGVVRVMDFGIAKHHLGATGGHTVTATGTLMGTPEYMSPEQLRGEPVDFRSDLYSFGVVLYELFTGALPFRGDTPVATILRQLQDEADLSHARLPPALKPVLRRALAKTPAERYPRAEDMRRALHAARLGLRPIAPFRTSPTRPRSLRPTRRAPSSPSRAPGSDRPSPGSPPVSWRSPPSDSTCSPPAGSPAPPRSSSRCPSAPVTSSFPPRPRSRPRPRSVSSRRVARARPAPSPAPVATPAPPPRPAGGGGAGGGAPPDSGLGGHRAQPRLRGGRGRRAAPAGPGPQRLVPGLGTRAGAGSARLHHRQLRGDRGGRRHRHRGREGRGSPRGRC